MGMINADDLLKKFSIEEHCKKADDYFHNHTNTDHFRSKPFANSDEARELLHCFAEVIAGLRFTSGMRILDFGAGTCWTSQWLTQMGLEVTSLDVSSSALDIGREMYTSHPPIGQVPPNHFLLFDGRRIESPDHYFDRILCFDAFHHIPNTTAIIGEMARVVKPGGIVGFSEPGANHSLQECSQSEMQNFEVLERNVDIHSIWEDAQSVGFVDIKVAVVNAFSFHISPMEFDIFNEGQTPWLDKAFCDKTRDYLWRRRIFFLTRG
jgi:2-polyprenyl-3-methyl-5-hydroxy-6-metoxy-1,4-benzoquinol methylase